jgi:arabinose-5-phosphate isomerase
MGRITKNDILILISNSGNTSELIDLIKYAKLNKITLICIVSKKNSKLYKSSNIKLLIPEAEEAGYGIVPTTSTTSQLSIGDALAIAVMKKKKFSKLDFKKFHPAGSLANKLKTAGDLMLTKKKIPFVNENRSLEKALEILNSKKLGFIVIVDRQNNTKGVFTDGDLKRLVRKKKKIYKLKIKTVMTKNLFSVEKNTLASDILMQMNKKKITNVCVYSKENKKQTIGILHIHDLIKIFK